MPKILYTLCLICLGLCLTNSVSKSQWTVQIKQLAIQTEDYWHLPRGICRAFNKKENSERIDSAKPRVEQGFFNIGSRHYSLVYNSTKEFFIHNPDLINSIPFDIERIQESTSWGPFQLMGFNLRSLGCTKKYLSDLTTQEHFYYWAKFLSIYLKKYKPLSHAISMYNGPSAPKSYSKDILSWMILFSKDS